MNGKIQKVVAFYLFVVYNAHYQHKDKCSLDADTEKVEKLRKLGGKTK